MSFTYSLDYVREDGSHGGMSGGRNTLEETLTDMANSIAYYEQLGYVVQVEHVHEHCEHCKGYCGHKQGKRRIKWVPCKKCRGTGIGRVLTESDIGATIG